MKKKFYLLFLMCTVFGVAKAQTITERVEMTATAGSGEYSPMWHMAARQGLSSRESTMAYLRGGVEGNHFFSKSGLSLNWGGDFVTGYNLTYPIYVQQAYIDVAWKRVRLSVGQKERWGELGNPRLTTGALVESGNARPVPQVRFDLPEYWNIPGTKGWFGIKGHIAYGMFTDGGWQKRFVDADKPHTANVLYHSKSGFMRFGNAEKFPLTAEIGLQMTTQFGGTSYNRLGKVGNDITSPTRFKDFLLALIPLKGDSEYSMADQLNVAGNIVGSWLGRIAWHDKNWSLMLNYEHVFEDHSQMFWEYGLWTEQLVGIELELKKFQWIKGVTLEYFNLKNHSGPIYHDTSALIPDQISCQDNNYWHHTYNGWFYYGMMMGTPLVSSPIYNSDNTLTMYNNRSEAFHFGIEGAPLNWLEYRILYTYSNNWGTYGKPFKDIKHNTSGLLELTFKPKVFKGWSIAGSFAFDTGELYGNNYGGLLSIRHEMNFNLKKK